MRKFTEQENNWIKEFVEIKAKGIDYVGKLQVAQILRETFSFFALKWTIGDKPQIVIYNETGVDSKITNQQYYKVCDFIYFIKELESLGFIAMQILPSQKTEIKYNLLYDKNAYEYDETADVFTSIKQQNVSAPKDVKSLLKLANKKDKQIFNLDFAYDLQKYGLGIIYPLPLAVDYVNNDFKTLEERHHDEEMQVALDSVNESRKAAKTAFRSFVIAIISLIVSIVLPICNSQKIDPDQITTIEKTIKGNRIEEPLTVEIKDTILTKPVESSKPKNSLSQPNELQKKKTCTVFPNQQK